MTGNLSYLIKEVDQFWAEACTRYFEISKISLRNGWTELPILN